MNIIENRGNYLEVQSHINKDAIPLMENMSNISKDILEWVQFYYRDRNQDDLSVLNSYFEKHKNIYLRWIENWQISLLPKLERFMFVANDFNDETIDLLKNNKVTGLSLEKNPSNKFDLKKLLVFSDTLEELSIEGNYKNLELLVNETKNLKKLKLFSIGIDFDKINENSIEEFNHYGSKIKNWSGIIKLSNLKKIWVKTNTTLGNIDFLSELKELETLEFWYCSNITSFPDLSGLRKIKKILAYECKRLNNIDEVKKLKNIETNLNENWYNLRK